MQSSEEQKSQSAEYLCDYLYIDTQRLAHYYSQLSEHGLITQAKHSSRSGGNEDSQLNIGPRFFRGSIKQAKSADESLELQIDPAFRRPQETLDALYAAGYVAKNLGNIGQLCLIEGLLSIVDVRLMKEMWPLMSEYFAADAITGITNQKEKQKKHSDAKKEFSSIANVLQKIPHSLQGNLATTSGRAWYTLKPEFLLVNPDDLMFKCGCDIPGVWNMLCVVDAYPDDVFQADYSKFFSHELESGMRQMISGIRTLFGRPPERYGITPIMIFRTIQKENHEEISTESTLSDQNSE